MVLRERVRPQDLQAHLCDPSLSCPLRTRCVPPHLGHASGSPPASPSSASTCARRSPMSLLLSSTPSFLASCSIMSSIPRLPSTCFLADNIVAETRGRHVNGGLTESYVMSNPRMRFSVECAFSHLRKRGVDSRKSAFCQAGSRKSALWQPLPHGKAHPGRAPGTYLTERRILAGASPLECVFT